VLEAKAYERVGPSKDDVCVFDRKTFDLILARHQAGVRGPHWRVLASATGLEARLRQYCYLHGIVVMDPELLPLPYLLRAAAKPGADLLADPMLWDELVRLGERAVVPFEERYVPVGEDFIFNTRWWSVRDLEDLVWVQTELSDQVIASVDTEHPSYFA